MQIDDKRVEIDEAEERSILPLSDSILASWIRSISQTVRSYGIDPEPLMQKSGLDISLLTVPEARYPQSMCAAFGNVLQQQPAMT